MTQMKFREELLNRKIFGCSPFWKKTSNHTRTHTHTHTKLAYTYFLCHPQRIIGYIMDKSVHS